MQLRSAKKLHRKFDVEHNVEWAFEGIKSVNNFTHGYHRYPAKFVPQIVKRLIETYTKKGDKVADVFAGCGTTLVEAKLHGRKSVGVDINPVAQLITNAKISAINPIELGKSKSQLIEKIIFFSANQTYLAIHNERIDYWFREEEKNKIAFLYSLILEIEKEKVRNFYLCALSNILKNCSRWLQSSTKPQVDPDKKISDPFNSFKIQIAKMEKKNFEFYNELKKNKIANTSCEIKLADARNTRIHKESINAIITSPPYVTSYEYADIHQLTGYWYNYISDIIPFRRKFIGTFYSNSKDTKTASNIAKEIVAELSKIDIKSGREVANYFNDMFCVAKEMTRILKPNGVVCLVIGNTSMKEVKIKSAEAFAEMLAMNGLKIKDVIKRKIPHKLIPTIRDKQTGRFTTLDSSNSQLVYPEEFIIIAKKTNGSKRTRQ